MITNQDLILEIMNHLSLYELEKLCKVNHEMMAVCNQKHFWLNKINNKKLFLDINITNYTDINWLKVYKSLKKVNNDIFSMIRNNHVGKLYDTNPRFKMDYFGQLFNQYEPNFKWVKHYQEVTGIIANLKNGKGYIIIGINADGWHSSDEVDVSEEALKNILFTLYYDGAIK